MDARVTAFRTRVAEVRGLVDGLVSERGVVELSIAGLIAELTELTEPVGVMSGGGCDGVEWDERQAVVMDEVEACADDAMKAWGEVESEVRDRRVRCRDGVGRVLRELNGMFDE